MADIKFPSEVPSLSPVTNDTVLLTSKDGLINKVTVADVVAKTAEIVQVDGGSIPAIKGGTTAATAVALPNLGAGPNKYFEASWGYWKYNNVVLTNPNGVQGIPEGSEGVLFWNGDTQTWSISKVQVIFSVLDSYGYSVNKAISQNKATETRDLLNQSINDLNAKISLNTSNILSKESLSNKAQSIDDNSVKYPSNSAVKSYVDNKLNVLTDTSFGGVINDTKDLRAVPENNIWYFATPGTYKTSSGDIIADAEISILAYSKTSGWEIEGIYINISKDFIVYDNIESMRNMSNYEKELLVNGLVKGATVLGYYVKGDTPDPIDYYISTSIKEDNGGTIIKVNGVTLEHTISTRVNCIYFGVIYNNQNSIVALRNSDIFGIMINNDIKIEVTDTTYLEPRAVKVKSKFIDIYSNNNSIIYITKSGSVSSILDVTVDMDYISIIGVKLFNTSLLFANRVFFLFKESSLNVTISDYLTIENAELLGEISIRLSGNSTAPYTYIGAININNNIHRETQDCFQFTNVTRGSLTFSGNKLYNMKGVYLSSSTDDNTLRDFMGQDIIDNNRLINDDNCWCSRSGYHAMVVTRSNKSIYRNNTVEGLKSKTNLELYDIYQSAYESKYYNNTWKNNVVFADVGATNRNALYMGKGGYHKEVYNNTFIADKEWMLSIIANNPADGFLLSNAQWFSLISLDTDIDKPTSIYYTNNIVKVPELKNYAIGNSFFKDFVLDNNTFELENVQQFFFSVNHNAVGDKYYSFSNNIIRNKGTGKWTTDTFVGSSQKDNKVGTISVDFNNNVFEGIFIRYLFNSIKVDYLRCNNNNFDSKVIVADNFTTSLFYGCDVYVNTYANNNIITSAANITIYPELFASNGLIGKYNIKSNCNRVISTNFGGVPIAVTTYDYSIGYTIRASNTIKNISLINIPFKFDKVGNLKYKDYNTNTEYNIPINTPTVVLGNGNTSHTIYSENMGGANILNINLVVDANKVFIRAVVPASSLIKELEYEVTKTLI